MRNDNAEAQRARRLAETEEEPRRGIAQRSRRTLRGIRSSARQFPAGGGVGAGAGGAFVGGAGDAAGAPAGDDAGGAGV